MKNIGKYATLNALGASIYVILIALFIHYLGNGFLGTNNTVFIPIAMLMLLVFSAALMGVLIFGRSVVWYLDGKKREALYLLFYTLGIFFALTLIVFFLLVVLVM